MTASILSEEARERIVNLNVGSLKLNLIRTDAGTQSRVCLTTDVVAEYADRMLEGDQFPPVIVFHDGSDYYLADGFHRVMAAVRNEFKDILADVRKGSQKDALKYALGANQANGLRRTNADKRRCVVMALEHFANLSDREIGKMCGVSQPFVGSMRSEQLITVISSTKRVGADGKARAASRVSVKTNVAERPVTSEIQNGKGSDVVGPKPGVDSHGSDSAGISAERLAAFDVDPFPASVAAPAVDAKACAFRARVEKLFAKFLKHFEDSEQAEVKAVVARLIA